ncbi:flagellar assembly factor FliW [Lachnospiraceae bacterium KM106-2]|nr:flagellar assembly factor FliW [Lachnospiraceae bacterium KM106-2]
MLVRTKYFGEVNITEDKIVHFQNGIMGFEQYKDYTIIYDNESSSKQTISWLQSIEKEELALPIISPLTVDSSYNPTVNEEWMQTLGNLNDENLAMFLVLTVPADITKMTANMKAPIIINSDTRQASQIIVENKEYTVKRNIYEIFNACKKEKEEK